MELSLEIQRLELAERVIAERAREQERQASQLKGLYSGSLNKEKIERRSFKEIQSQIEKDAKAPLEAGRRYALVRLRSRFLAQSRAMSEKASSELSSLRIRASKVGENLKALEKQTETLTIRKERLYKMKRERVEESRVEDQISIAQMKRTSGNVLQSASRAEASSGHAFALSSVSLDKRAGRPSQVHTREKEDALPKLFEPDSLEAKGTNTELESCVPHPEQGALGVIPHYSDKLNSLSLELEKKGDHDTPVSEVSSRNGEESAGFDHIASFLWEGRSRKEEASVSVSAQCENASQTSDELDVTQTSERAELTPSSVQSEWKAEYQATSGSQSDSLNQSDSQGTVPTNQVEQMRLFRNTHSQGLSLDYRVSENTVIGIAIERRKTGGIHVNLSPSRPLSRIEMKNIEQQIVRELAERGVKVHTLSIGDGLQKNEGKAREEIK